MIPKSFSVQVASDSNNPTVAAHIFESEGKSSTFFSVGFPGAQVTVSATPEELRAIAKKLVACADAFEAEAAQ